MLQISHQFKSPNISSREGSPIRCIILHATVGNLQSARGHLTNPATGVSCHYLISKDGSIYQLVDDADRAHHAGKSVWRGVTDVNDFSIGIELENKNNGVDPYPQPQLEALHWLCARLLTAYHLTPDCIDTHAAVALPAKRKSDPAGFPLAWLRASLAPPAAAPRYTELSPLFGTGRASAERVIALLLAKNTSPDAEYQEAAIREIVGGYLVTCARAGVNSDLALAQMIHETDWLRSFFAARPRRNPAGIGVTGDTRPGSWPQPQPPALWHYDPELNVWRFGLAFGTWALHSIPAHVGRILAWVLTDRDIAPFPNGGDPQLHQHQRALIAQAQTPRSLPSICRGTVTTLKDLGKVHNRSGYGWADDGKLYGQMIAKIANQLIGEIS